MSTVVLPKPSSGTEIAGRLYERVIQQANRFLHHCRNYSIAVLALEDPTYDQIADQYTELAGVIKALSKDFDPMMGQKAIEYAELMRNMALAIRNHNEEWLSTLVEELSRKPGT